jgi:outer membrane protein OmpU
MKKLLLVSTALAGVAMMSSPASAALKMDLGGYFDGYGVYADNNDVGGAGSLHQYAFRRDTDVFVNGESTLDNGLTVGAHTDIILGNNGAAGTTDTATQSVYLNEVYGYGSGGWGRVNLGVGDGAAYLLQVSAPSADSNVDGLRANIAALNALPVVAVAGPATSAVTTQDTRLAGLLGTGLGFGAAGQGDAFGAATSTNLSYAQDDFRQTDRLTYLTPKFNGFQAGASYAPQPGIQGATSPMALDDSNTGAGSTATGTAATFKNVWEAGARWDGEFQGVAGSLGAGYSGSSLAGNETAFNTAHTPGSAALTDGPKTWNVGGNIGMAGFNLGAIYKESKVEDEVYAATTAFGTETVEAKTYVVGLGYDNGPYHLGGSYQYDKTTDPGFDTALASGNWTPGAVYKETKFTLGGGYTYAPGMTFRGAVAWGKLEADSTGVGAGDAANGNTAAQYNSPSNDFTQVTLGTAIAF